MSNSETKPVNTPESQQDLTQSGSADTEEMTQPAQPNTKAAATQEKPAPAAKPDEATAPADHVEDPSVKLTDISDIVAKYSAVDSVFGDEDEAAGDTFEEDIRDTGQGQDDIDVLALDMDDEDLFEAQDDDVDEDTGARTREVADSLLPERPRIVFRRPQMKKELFSDWADDPNDAVEDVKPSQFFHRSRLFEEEDVTAEPDLPVIEQHRRTLSRSIALSIGLPIAGGALFALFMFLQKDIKPADYWAWLAGSVTGPTVAAVNDTPTPNFVRQPSAPQEEASGTPVVSSTDAPTVVSPETGIARAAVVSVEPAPEAAAETVPQAAPEAVSATVANTVQTTQATPNPVFMARLTVTDTEGSSLTPIPLSLAVAPAVPEQQLRIRISGLPSGARLSAGTDLANGEWMLRQSELEDLSMTLAPGFSGQITLLAEVIDDATHIQAAPSQMVEVRVTPGQMVVQPAAAPPDPAPHSFAEAPKTVAQEQPTGPTLITPQVSPFAELRVQAPNPSSTPAPKVAALAPPTQTDATAAHESIAEPTVAAAPPQDGLMAKGDEFLSNGDIVAARLFYERALKKGNPRAATAIGKSYDPVIYQELKVHGVLPDPDLAVEWYQRGAKNGDAAANAHIQTLNDWIRQ